MTRERLQPCRQLYRLSMGLVLLPALASCGGRDTGAGEVSTGESESGIASLGDSGPMLDLAGGSGSASQDGNQEGEADTGCAEVEVSTEPVIPTVVLLVDQSGSMSADFSGQPRWDALYDTLMDPTDGVVQQLESTVRFGLTLYTSDDGFSTGECPLLTEVPPALDNHAAIDAVYSAEAPVEDTPTGESIAAVAADLDAFNEEGPKLIVLATDGEPDTCDVPDPQEGQPESLAAAQAAYAMGIETYVISVGDEVSAQHLQEMANAGVGLDPMGQDQAPYYLALDAGDLIAAFEEIIYPFISCTLELDGIVELDQACEGTVWLDDVELECDVDWHLLDASTLELLGDACATFQDGQIHTVTASWPCDAVSIP